MWLQHLLKEVQLHSPISGILIWTKFAIFYVAPNFAQIITPQDGYHLL